jgi:hypothetical protein
MAYRAPKLLKSLNIETWTIRTNCTVTPITLSPCGRPGRPLAAPRRHARPSPCPKASPGGAVAAQGILARRQGVPWDSKGPRAAPARTGERPSPTSRFMTTTCRPRPRGRAVSRNSGRPPHARGTWGHPQVAVTLAQGCAPTCAVQVRTKSTAIQ